MFPVRTLVGGMNIVDQVTATLIKDGKVIKRVVGVRMHNEWSSTVGLFAIIKALELGGSGTTPLMGKTLSLGSACSDVTYTDIGGSDRSTTNTPVGFSQTKFTANWAAAGAISNICQVALWIQNYTGSATIRVALYNFGTSFTKPDGVSLKLEWTVTLTST